MGGRLLGVKMVSFDKMYLKEEKHPPWVRVMEGAGTTEDEDKSIISSSVC